MARLIDVDRLLRNIASIPDLRKLSIKTISEAIDACPLIESIPLSYIKKEIEVTKQLSGTCKYSEALGLLLMNYDEDSNGIPADRRYRWD